MIAVLPPNLTKARANSSICFRGALNASDADC